MTCAPRYSFHARVVSVSTAFAGGTRIEIAVQHDCNEVPAFFGDLIVHEFDGRDAQVGDIWSFVCSRVIKAEDVVPVIFPQPQRG